MNNRQTRSASSQEGRLSLEDVKTLILKSEERIISKLEEVVTRINQIERRIDHVQTEQISLGHEISSIKEVVIKQQRIIEKHEAEKRELNLIFSGVPESDITVDDETFENDDEKIKYLCEEVISCWAFDSVWDSITSCQRLGKKKNGHNRLIKVKFNDYDAKNSILRSQKAIRNNAKCVENFGLIYINKDSSLLMRNEEKRLRDALRQERRNAQPGTKCYIRSGKLFRNDDVIDQIDVANQLF